MLALVLGCVPIVFGNPSGSARGSFGVSVVVLPYTKVETLHQVQQFDITPADIARGYVDIPHATTLRLRSNHATGHDLVLVALGSVFTRLELKGVPTAPLVLGAMGGRVHLPLGNADTTYELGYRLHLSDNVAAAGHEWPLALYVEPA